MKTIYLVFDKTTDHVLGAYETPEILQFEVLIKSFKHEIDPRNIYIKKDENVAEPIWNQLIQRYKRKEKWN